MVQNKEPNIHKEVEGEIKKISHQSLVSPKVANTLSLEL
jgi:hypothetical protein